MSLATWIKDFVSQRKNIHGRILSIKSYSDVTYVYLALENRSRLPIAVTSIDLVLNQSTYTCTALPTLVSSTTRRCKDTILKYAEEYSTSLPIRIQQLGAASILALFENMNQLPPDDATTLMLVIYTNRGKPVQMTLELPEGWAFQRRTP